MFAAITNLLQSNASGSGTNFTVKQQVQEFVKNIRRKSESTSSPGSSPTSSPVCSPPKPETIIQDHLDTSISDGEIDAIFAFQKREVLYEKCHSRSRYTRHHNIGDDMNENWIFENKSVTLEASNCHVCGEYIMTSNYDFYVDILQSKCMCKCDH
jgi:hypothetical protein